MVLFCGKTCGDAEIVVSLQCVFHSIRFKVNKGLGSQRRPIFVSIRLKNLWDLMLFLRFLGALPKQTTVVLHQFPDQQEGVNGCDAVGDQPRDVLTLGTSFALDESLVPQGTELGIVLLYFRCEFFLTESDLFKCVILSR